MNLNLCIYSLELHLLYYSLRSNLHIERSAVLDDVTSRAGDLKSGCVFIEGFYQNKNWDVRAKAGTYILKYRSLAKRKGKLLYHVRHEG